MLMKYIVKRFKVIKYVMLHTIIPFHKHMPNTYTKLNFATLHYLFCTIFGNEKSAIIVNLRLQNVTKHHI